MATKTHTPEDLPEAFDDVEALEEALSRPSQALIEMMGRLDGDVLILGVGGKMGPTLARMARRAADAAGVRRDIVGVSRFGSGDLRDRLEGWGVRTIASDLLDPDALAKLPDAPNVVYMAGFKFGSTGNESRTWAMNVILPGMVGRRFTRSRIVAFSSGNIYAPVLVDSGGSVEGEPPGPVGEYAMSCLGRERAFEFYCTQRMPVAIIRLTYACELRYGVIVDLAQRIAADQPVDLTTGYFNVIWQGDANDFSLRALEHTDAPPFLLNVTGEETLRVKDVAERLAERMGKAVRFTGEEALTALLTNAGKAHAMFNPPTVKAERLIDWIADWIAGGGETLDKPTHFEVRDGKY